MDQYGSELKPGTPPDRFNAELRPSVPDTLEVKLWKLMGVPEDRIIEFLGKRAADIADLRNKEAGGEFLFGNNARKPEALVPRPGMEEPGILEKSIAAIDPAVMALGGFAGVNPMTGRKAGPIVGSASNAAVAEMMRGAAPAGRPRPSDVEALKNALLKDAEGNPRVFYHGSLDPNVKAQDLDPTRPPVRARSGPAGVYFTPDKSYAIGFTRSRQVPGSRGRVVSANLSMENPLDITEAVKSGQSKGLSFSEAKKEALKSLSPEHDGIIFNGDSYNPPEYVVFNSKQISDVDALKKELSPEFKKPTEGIDVYHGTAYGEELAKSGGFDPSKATEGSLYGPGIYTTDNPNVASTYTKKGAPKQSSEAVVPMKYKVNPESTIDMDGPAPKGLVEIFEKLDHVDYPVDASGKAKFDNAHDFYQSLVENFGTKADANDWLVSNGISTIKYKGGVRTGGEQHNVYVNLTGHDLVSKLTGQAMAGKFKEMYEPRQFLSPEELVRRKAISDQMEREHREKFPIETPPFSKPKKSNYVEMLPAQPREVIDVKSLPSLEELLKELSKK